LSGCLQPRGPGTIEAAEPSTVISEAFREGILAEAVSDRHIERPSGQLIPCAMRVLAIDTALTACSVAVLDTQAGAVTARETHGMARGHAEALMPMIARVVDMAGIEFGDLDRIAVTVGPGSFTGLRVGISAARGIALAAEKPAIGLSTLAAFAAPHIAADDSVPVISVIDARHDHVYLQVFGPGGRTLVTPRVITIRDAIRASVTTAAPRLTGTGANLLAAAWPAAEPLPDVIDAREAPDIDWIARLGAAAAANQGRPRPLYLRGPDARPQDAARLPRR
jgi:tRNA threonylcarbamoyl adenosine modification protein YeaZ